MAGNSFAHYCFAGLAPSPGREELFSARKKSGLKCSIVILLLSVLLLAQVLAIGNAVHIAYTATTESLDDIYEDLEEIVPVDPFLAASISSSGASPAPNLIPLSLALDWISYVSGHLLAPQPHSSSEVEPLHQFCSYRSLPHWLEHLAILC